jgi:hypothetical protein
MTLFGSRLDCQADHRTVVHNVLCALPTISTSN